ncbi:unnamed protein product [Mucor hiemalis]
MGIFASNSLWMNPSWGTRPWFTRRSIVLTMKKIEPGATPPPKVYTDADAYTFCMRCLSTRLRSPTPPVTMRMALVTILGYGVSYATRGVAESERATPYECMTATTAISISTKVEYDTLTVPPASIQAFFYEDGQGNVFDEQGNEAEDLED